MPISARGEKMDTANGLDFSNQQVLVCGGSDGIGYGIAKMFLQLHADVAITGTREAGNYDHDFAGMAFHTLDVRDEQAIDELAGKFRQLHVLVNCIGSVLYKQREFDREGFEQIIAINLTGAMLLYTRFFPLLRAGAGNIVMLDSVASLRPAVNNPAYSASKAGLAQLCRALAMKWGRDGIRVNTVAPGLVLTKLTANQSSPEQQARFEKTNPIPRLGTPQDIAGAVAFLASPLASYVTGQQLVVDGGLTL
jgi:3-oxoacyl-[acyl-carrier protein] reductase